MGYVYKSKVLRAFNRVSPTSAQLDAVRANFWDSHLIETFKEHPELLLGFLNDINDILAYAEANSATDDFAAVAKVCIQMTIKGDPKFLQALLDLGGDLVGTFIMRCMRIANLALHDSSTVKSFLVLFQSLGVKVSGDYGTCVTMASFEWTEYGDGVLTVAPPGGNK